MKKVKILWRNTVPVIFSVILILILMMIPTGFEQKQIYQNADRVRAEILSTDESDIVDNGLIRTGEQRCKVKILDGKFKGETTVAINRLSGSLAQDKLFSVGDTAYAAVSYHENSITTVMMTDHYRLDKEAVLAGIFLLLLIIFAGKTGIRAILSFITTILLMWKVLVPCMLKGWNPIWLSIGIVLLMTTIILSLIYGFDRRCLASVSGAFLGIAVIICRNKFHVPEKSK